MGVCTAKPIKRIPSSPKESENQIPSSQLPNTTKINSPLCDKAQDQIQTNPTIKAEEQTQQIKEILERDEQAALQNIKQEKEAEKIDNPKASFPIDHSDDEEEEEEKIDAKKKQTMVSIDQQSTQFTAHLNELASKKDYQTSETSTNNPMRQKKPTKINTYDQGFVVQIFEPTQNSMEDTFSINEVDEQMEDEEVEEVINYQLIFMIDQSNS